MLTLTKTEHESIVDQAVQSLSAEGKATLKDIKRGADVHDRAKHFRNLNSLLYSLEYYQTGEFQAEEYFNVQTSDDQFKTSSNTKMRYYHGKITCCKAQ